MKTLKPAEALQKLKHSINGQPFAVMLVGVPGSGKSTFIQRLREAGFSFEVASTDDLIEAEAQANGVTYSEIFGKVNFKHLNKRFQEKIAQDSAAGKNVIIDQTNMSKKSRRSKISLVAATHQKLCIVFDVEQKELQKRLEARAQETGKVIPEHVMKSMLNNYDSPSKDEGFDVIIHVDNT